MFDLFWPILAGKPQNKNFPKKIISDNFKTLRCCNLGKEIRKTVQRFFMKLI